ncbi:trypsin-1-like [Schistocerca americana]|uniref:trypsin-1-like n=1 Tax=Schistocerca americana TaxID=7009 RepID=UPI001F4F7090|nr:trypsin-1-like [Schistocerca americana]
MDVARCLLWLLAALPLFCRNAECRSLHRHRRIVGGLPANITEVPYSLSLQLDGKHMCGAVIINENWAVTTGYCYNLAVPAQNATVRAGSSVRETGGSVHTVERFVPHSHYVPAYSDYDIAVLKVKPAFRFSKKVKPVKLPKQDEEFSAGTVGVVAGWGTKNFGVPKYTRTLYKVEVPIIDFAECDKSYMYFGGVNKRMICAAYPSGGKDSCQGDNGGGLVAKRKLVGLVSWAIGCARSEYPHVYTRVSAFSNWILNNTNV